MTWFNSQVRWTQWWNPHHVTISLFSTVEPLFRGHPRDQGKCPLERSVPWMEVGLGFVNNWQTKAIFTFYSTSESPQQKHTGLYAVWLQSYSEYKNHYKNILISAILRVEFPNFYKCSTLILVTEIVQFVENDIIVFSVEVINPLYGLSCFDRYDIS